MSRDLTNDEKQRLGLVDADEQPTFERGWTNERIKQAIKDKGFTISGLERALNLSPRSLNQSLNVRFPKADKMLAAFLDVHESEVWPNRYLANGKPMPAAYNIEHQTDEFLAKLNAEVLKPQKIIVIRSWMDGDRYEYDAPEPSPATFESDKPKNADGTVNSSFYDQPIYDDVPARADERKTVTESVSLPLGMNIDVK